MLFSLVHIQSRHPNPPLLAGLRHCPMLDLNQRSPFIIKWNLNRLEEWNEASAVGIEPTTFGLGSDALTILS